jgi:hypothetical protein
MFRHTGFHIGGNMGEKEAALGGESLLFCPFPNSTSSTKTPAKTKHKVV